MLPLNAYRRALRHARAEFLVLEERTLLAVIPPGGFAAVFPRPESPPAERLLVRLQEGVTFEQRGEVLAAAGVIVRASYPAGPMVVETGLGGDPAHALEVFRASPLVIYAEPNSSLTSTVTGYAKVAPTYPNDPSFGSQWGLNSSGEVDVDAPEAWSVTTGSRNTIVAILDTGVDLQSPALKGRLWTDPATAGSRRPIHGWNFVTSTANIQDNNGHGTHVAGIIAATGNDRNGVVGLDWNARIMPLKILGADGSGSLDSAISAVYYAVDHGARVINASWGTNEDRQALADALQYADSHGVVFVNAAGNDSSNLDQVMSYPAAYRSPNLLVVAAVDSRGKLASFSNYGSRTVDLAAPGVNILSTYLKGNAWLSGTSMATPFVTGVVSLLASLHPDWTAEQLVQRVLATAKPLPGLEGLTITGGIVDAAQALGVGGSGPDGNHYKGPPLASKKVVVRKAHLHQKATPTKAEKVGRTQELAQEVIAAKAFQPLVPDWLATVDRRLVANRPSRSFVRFLVASGSRGFR